MPFGRPWQAAASLTTPAILMTLREHPVRWVLSPVIYVIYERPAMEDPHAFRPVSPKLQSKNE